MPRNSRKNQKSYTNVYHIILRSINQQEIFYDNTDRKKFLKYLRTTKEKYQYDLYAYVLMDNHIHLLLREKEDNLSKIIQSLAISYALYFNKKYNRIGHVFYNRFKSKYVENLLQLLNIIRYIHFNPEKAKVQDFSKFYWSSYQNYFQNDGIVDSVKILKMVEMDIEGFKNFHEEYRKMKNCETDDFEMENKNLNDETAIKRIKEKMNIDNLVSIQNFKTEKRDAIIAQIATIDGIGRRQLARILGLNERTIYRAIQKNKSYYK